MSTTPHRPTSKQVRFVVSQFDKAIRKYPNLILDMSQGEVNANGHKCGTVHCHGGTYAAIRATKLERSLKHLKFDDGAIWMSRDLGFNHDDEDAHDLRTWAMNNPDIWGNNEGNRMFGSDGDAFISEKRPYGARSVSDIRDHWNEVADRLEKIEREECKLKLRQQISNHI